MTRSRTRRVLSCVGAIGLWLLSVTGAAGSPAGERMVSVVVEVAGGGGFEAAGSVEIIASPVAVGEDVRRVVPLAQGRGAIDVPLRKHDLWRLAARSPGLWSEPRIVEPDTSSLRLTLWPATTVVTRLAGASGPLRSDRVPVRLEPSPREGGSAPPQPPGEPEVSCPIGVDGVVSCDLPRGRWHLRFDPDGYAPFYVWDVLLLGDEPQELETPALLAGGSVFGRVAAGEEPIETGRAAVTARPRLDPGGTSPEERRDLRKLTREAEIVQGGRFQIVGLSPGEVYVEAHAREGAAASRPRVVEVADGAAVEMEEPLVLLPPARLVIELEPRTDPYGRPWSVRLHRVESASSLRVEGRGPTDELGVWRSEPLAEGRYSVQVLDRDGSSFAWQEVEVVRGAPPVRVEIPVVYVDGEVLLGGERLASTVWFGGRTGAERIEVETDDDGAFFVILPRAGEWEVDVVADDPPVVSRGLEVEVDPLDDLRAARVTVEVPDTRVVGTVVDETGLPPVSPARVHLTPADGRGRAVSTEASPAGGFEIAGVEPGSYAAEASAGDLAAEAQFVEIAEDAEIDLRLVVRARRTAAGRVVSEAGPVPHALVLGFPLSDLGLPPTVAIPDARTGVDGRFRLRLPAETRRLRLVTLAPGFALDVREIAEGARPEIVLRRESGALRLGSLALGDRERTDVALLVVNGQPIDVYRLLHWARIQGGPAEAGETLAVPGMPPGAYALCRMQPREALLVMTGAARPAASACSEGHLAAGGELRLEAPG